MHMGVHVLLTVSGPSEIGTQYNRPLQRSLIIGFPIVLEPLAHVSSLHAHRCTCITDC